jgi:hypothetical protein
MDFLVIFKYHMPTRFREDGGVKQFVSALIAS